MDTAWMVKILEDATPIEVVKEDIVADIDFIPQGVVGMQRDIYDRKEAQDIYNLFANDPIINPIWSRTYYLTAIGKEKEIPEALKQPEPAQQGAPPEGLAMPEGGETPPDVGTKGALNPQLLQSGPMNRMGG